MTRTIPTHVLTDTGQLACTANRDLFDYVSHPAEFGQHDKPTHAAATSAVTSLCHACPRFTECLRESLTGPATKEFVAASTPAERAEMQDLLGVTPVSGRITKRDLGGAGADVRGERIAPEVIARMIAAHPDWHSTQVAEALRIDPQTVRRHMHRYPNGVQQQTVTQDDVEVAWDLLHEATNAAA